MGLGNGSDRRCMQIDHTSLTVLTGVALRSGTVHDALPFSDFVIIIMKKNNPSFISYLDTVFRRSIDCEALLDPVL